MIWLAEYVPSMWSLHVSPVRTYLTEIYLASPYDPYPCQFLDDVEGRKRLEVINEYVWDPEVFQELQVDGGPLVGGYGHVGPQPRLLPFNRQVHRHSDAELFVIHLKIYVFFVLITVF